jgi:cyclophilin family peptidyl-prolyl cis-trans isomerase
MPSTRPFLVIICIAALFCAQASARGKKPAKETVLVMKTTQGEVFIRFFADKAPEHVRNFLHHARSGLYKKTYFHRVVAGFMVQGGNPNTKNNDPADDGSGGYSYKGRGTSLKAEFNDTPHLRGVLSMARLQSPDSAGSQFFIMAADNRGLDGKYSAFGRVIRGMDAVDKIISQPGTEIPGAGGVNPTEHQYIEGFTFEEWTADDIYLAEAKEYGADKCLRMPLVLLETTSGEVGIGFFGDKAPEHVRNFLLHCRSGFYEGTYFHRVIPGFMIQGGDPNTKNDDPADDGSGGHSYKGLGKFLKAEFNEHKHVRGIVSMARSTEPDSAGSQFFIMVEEKAALDGKYSAFGRVLFGMEAVDKIVSTPGAKIPGDDGVNPTEHQFIKTARVLYQTSKQIKAAAYEAERRRALTALETPKGKQHVAILDTTQGKVYIRFFCDKAPLHVYNFLEHCRSGFYKGTYFHRVFPGFMIQGGDPNTKDDDPKNDGKGGHSYKGLGKFLKAEFNDTDHVRGILSMARSTDPDSAGSQFFILVAANSGLNGKYSAFGRVIRGMSAVDKIVRKKGKEIPGAGGFNPDRHQYIKKAVVELWTDRKVRSYDRKRR